MHGVVSKSRNTGICKTAETAANTDRSFQFASVGLTKDARAQERTHVKDPKDKATKRQILLNKNIKSSPRTSS